MKKRIKKFLFKDDGSVSIFSILLILPIFMINALFIDAIRIISAQKQVETVLETSLRSTMSNFSETATAKGLFVYNDSAGSPNEVFKSYVEANDYDPGDLDGFHNLVNTQFDMSGTSASFDTSRNVIMPKVFDSQIKETMKYQAPIQAGADFLTLFQKGENLNTEEVDQAAELAEKYEEIAELIVERNKILNKLHEGDPAPFSDLHSKIAAVQGNLVGSMPSEFTDEINLSDSTYNKVGKIYSNSNRYKEISKSAAESDEESEEGEEKSDSETDDNSEEIEKYKDGVNQSKSKYLAEMKKKEIEDLIDKQRQHLFGGKNNDKNSTGSSTYASAIKYQREIDELLSGETEGDLSKIQQGDISIEFFNSISDDLDEIEDKLLRDEKEEVTIGSKGSGYQNYSFIEIYKGFLKIAEKGKDTKPAEIKNYAVAMNKVLEEVEAANNAIKEKWDSDYSTAKTFQENQNATEEEEEKADESILDLINLIQEFKDASDADAAVYDELTKNASDYASFAGEVMGDTPQEGLSEDRTEFMTAALQKFQEFGEFLTNPNAVANEVYINEYIMGYFGVDGPYNLDPGTIDFENKKALYILYGNGSTTENYGQLLVEIASIIFAVNLFTQILQGGFHPLKIIFAIGQAAIFTAQNITQLTNNGFLDFAPFKKFGMPLEVHLTVPFITKLFLTMRSFGGEGYNNAKKYRTQAVITHDTGINLIENGNTYLKASIEGEVNLLFIPMFGNWTTNIQNGNYVIKREKVFSY